jgi:hypothetical protein
MKRCIVGALLVLAVSPGAVRADEKDPPRHLTDARKLVQSLDLRHTSYDHGKADIQWSGVCESHADCSGFLDALLTHSYGYNEEQFKKWFDSHRPSARRYHDAIVDQHGFTEIKELSHVRPGDILAVKYLKRKDNTGHIMVVAGTPRQVQPKRPLVEGTAQWEVVIIDSSESGHGNTDTRHHKGPGGKDHQGLGEGVLRVYTDRQEHVVGFTWSALEKSEFKGADDEHLVAGRLKPNFKP